MAPDVSNPLENEKLKKKTITTKDDFESVKLEAEDFEFRKVDFDQKFGKIDSFGGTEKSSRKNGSRKSFLPRRGG